MVMLMIGDGERNEPNTDSHQGIWKIGSFIGKSLSEALIFASTNPQYDDNLFIELQVQYIHENSNLKPGENMLCREIVSDIQNNICTQNVLSMFCKKKSF